MHLGKLEFKVFVPVIILDRDSQIWFHKTMPRKTKAESTVHRIVNSLSLKE